MTWVDLLSDTTYREQAIEQLDRQLDDAEKFPVKRSQIYGLRQIARQQPGKVEAFAKHQKNRACRKYDNASEKAKPGLQAEINFWELAIDLCSDSASDWSVPKEGRDYLPPELQEIPERQPGMTHEEQRHRNELRRRQREWLEQWKTDHIPAFFERFCTHYLYRQGMAENP